MVQIPPKVLSMVTLARLFVVRAWEMARTTQTGSRPVLDEDEFFHSSISWLIEMTRLFSSFPSAAGSYRIVDDATEARLMPENHKVPRLRFWRQQVQVVVAVLKNSYYSTGKSGSSF